MAEDEPVAIEEPVCWPVDDDVADAVVPKEAVAIAETEAGADIELEREPRVGV